MHNALAVRDRERLGHSNAGLEDSFSGIALCAIFRLESHPEKLHHHLIGSILRAVL